jgi:hypothetical protein
MNSFGRLLLGGSERRPLTATPRRRAIAFVA